MNRHRVPLWLMMRYFFERTRLALRRRSEAARQANESGRKFWNEVWHDAARANGCEFRDLGWDIFEVTQGSFRTYVTKNNTALDGFATLCVALNKPLTYQLLREAGLPVPRHLTFELKTVAAAINFLKAASGPCVVEPANGTGGGWGVTTGVRRVSELRRAAATARVYGPEIIVEEQVAGENYRLLFLDGKLLDAVVRHPPHVVADGRSTIADLVREANLQRLAVSTATSPRLVPLDLDLRFTLRDQGLTLSSRPPRGTRVTLKTVINDNDASDNETVTGRLDQALIAQCARAVEAVGVRLAGVDVITTNLSRSLIETSGRIIEVNTSPGYQWHYHKREGATPIARQVLRRMIEDHQAQWIGGLPNRQPQPLSANMRHGG